jgi:Na+/H+ antiporter NhaC
MSRQAPDGSAGAGDSTALVFHGGNAGALAPFVLFLAGVAWLALSGAPEERGLWPVLLAALALGMALARDRRRYAEALIGGMAQPLVALMILAWALAGVIGTLLNAGGLVTALVEVARAAGVTGGGYAVAAFVICAVLSTATGTSLGTLILCAPLLYPAAAALGASPAILMGAILGGATFGDNISPVSDTTIASATTQGAELGAVVRSRLRYAIPAALFALTCAAVWGGGGAETTGLAAAASGGTLRPLLLLLVPAGVIGLLLAGRHLLEGLFFGAASAALVGLALGLLAPADLLHLELENYAARGLIVDGIERALGVSVFTLLLMGLVAGLEEARLTERLLDAVERRARSPRGAEGWTFAVTSAAVLLTTHSVVALLSVGSFARRVGEHFGLSPERRANLLDVTVCTYPFLLPYCIPTILAASLTSAGGAVGLPRLSAWTIGLVNFHSWGLLAVLLFAIATGWGRRLQPAVS